MNKRPYLPSLIPALCLLLSIFTHKVSAETLTIAVLVAGGEQRTLFTNAIGEFEANNPEIRVKLIAKNDSEFKESLNKWLKENDGPDIIHWQGGERLFQYVKQGKVARLDQFWEKHDLQNTFSQGSISAVSYKNTPYAIPISYYQWGMFYRKSLFRDLGISTPETWEDFLQACQTLKRAGITPVTIGTKNNWPSAAWFDYLNLRINGLEFHRQLLTGDISFTDPRSRKVFETWKSLIDQGYFVAKQRKWDWKQAMPFLYHKKAGMTLVGNFFAGQLPETIREDFAFFRFPVIDEQMPLYEEAPLDLFMVPRYSPNKKLAEKFLLQVSGINFQENYNTVQRAIAPNVAAKPESDYFTRIGAETLQSAQGLSQFFDRDTNTKMAGVGTQIFGDFMQDPNVSRTIKQLEEAREEFLLK